MIRGCLKGIGGAANDCCRSQSTNLCLSIKCVCESASESKIKCASVSETGATLRGGMTETCITSWCSDSARVEDVRTGWGTCCSEETRGSAGEESAVAEETGSETSANWPGRVLRNAGAICSLRTAFNIRLNESDVEILITGAETVVETG